jgi:hypothetical protein
MADSIDKVLESRRQPVSGPAPAPVAAAVENKFFSIPLGEGLHEHFLELHFRVGLKTCFSYGDLSWFNYDPEGFLDLVFGGFLVTIKGRGLGDRLFHGIKQKRVAWIKEADTQMEDHKGNDAFISEIIVTQPDGPGGGEPEPE